MTKEEIIKEAVDMVQRGSHTLSEAIDWAMREQIKKSNEWLKNNVDDYLYNTGGRDEYIPKCGGKLYSALEKAMEE